MNNKGLSLVELIVVISIIAITTGLVITSPALLNGRKVKITAENLVAVIDKARVESMGKDELKLIIKKDADGKVIAEGNLFIDVVGTTPADKRFKPKFTSEVCGDDIELYFSPQTDGSGLVPLLPGQDLELTFKRNSGAINSSTVLFFKLSKGTFSRVVKIYKETGKVVIE